MKSEASTVKISPVVRSGDANGWTTLINIAISFWAGRPDLARRCSLCSWSFLSDALLNCDLIEKTPLICFIFPFTFFLAERPSRKTSGRSRECKG